MKVVNARLARTRRDCRAQKVTRKASSIMLELDDVLGLTLLTMGTVSGLGISSKSKATRAIISRWR